MNIRMLAFDIDGTLRGKKGFPEINCRALQEDILSFIQGKNPEEKRKKEEKEKGELFFCIFLFFLQQQVYCFME